MKRGADKPPHAFVIPAGQRDQTQVDRVANLLRRQAIEVHRATAEIKVKEGTFPAGSYIVKLNQPYGPLAKTLIEKQNYPDPALTTYDDSAWSMGMANNIDDQDHRGQDDPRCARHAADRRCRRPPGTVAGTGAVTIVKHNGALNLITLRYRLKDVAMKGAKAAFKVGDVEFPAGSLIIESAGDRVRKEVASLGLVATAAASAPTVETVNVDLPRIAMYTTWANTEKVGWVRLGVRSLGDPVRSDPQGSRAGRREPALEVRRDRDAAPDPERQVDRLRAAEAVEAAALQEERQVQVAGHVCGNRRRARRHGARGRGGVPEVRRRRRRADDAGRRQLLPRRVRHRQGRRRAERRARASTRRGRT